MNIPEHDHLRIITNALYNVGVKHELNREDDPDIPKFASMPDETFYSIDVHGVYFCFDKDRKFLGTVNDETGDLIRPEKVS